MLAAGASSKEDFASSASFAALLSHESGLRVGPFDRVTQFD